MILKQFDCSMAEKMFANNKILNNHEIKWENYDIENKKNGKYLLYDIKIIKKKNTKHNLRKKNYSFFYEKTYSIIKKQLFYRTQVT
jgi:hypothetical protein